MDAQQMYQQQDPQGDVATGVATGEAGEAQPPAIVYDDSGMGTEGGIISHTPAGVGTGGVPEWAGVADSEWDLTFPGGDAVLAMDAMTGTSLEGCA